MEGANTELEEDSPLLATGNDAASSNHHHQHSLTLFPDEIVNSPISTIFLILNVMIGAGFLVQPYVFKQSGILTATILYAYFAYSCFEGASLLIHLAKHYQIFDFADIVFACFGIYGAVSLDSSIVCIMGGSVLSYALLLGSLSSTVVDQYTTTTAWYTSDAFLTTLWVVLIIFPMCTARQLGHLAIIAYYSIGVVFATTFLIILGGPIMYTNSSSEGSILWVTSGVGSLSAMGSILFAMAYLPAVLPAYQSAQTQTKRHFTHYLLLCSVVGVVMYYFLGLVGYLTFRDSVEVDILENFSGVWSTVFQIGICFHLAFIVPGYFVIIRQSLSNLAVCSYLLWQSSGQSQCTMSEIRSKRDRFADNDVYFFFSTLGLLLVIYLITLSIQITLGSDSSAVALVIAIAGGIAGSVEVFIIPGCCGMVTLAPSKFPAKQSPAPTPSSSTTSNRSSKSTERIESSYGTAVRSEADENDKKFMDESTRGYYYVWSILLVVTGVVVSILVTIGLIFAS